MTAAALMYIAICVSLFGWPVALVLVLKGGC